jgi:aerobic-type carbon monoxide dehydrogenase small subunit (CoxS/CutS family)
MLVLHAGIHHGHEGAAAENPNPTTDEVRHELAGNLCRCGSYSRIMASVLDAAERLRTSDGAAGPPE